MEVNISDKGRGEWSSESSRLVELALSAFETALLRLPVSYPTVQQHWFAAVRFERESDSERLEREICAAFFLRLKGLFEAQVKRCPGSDTPNWQSAEKLLKSLRVDQGGLSDEDRVALDKFGALRNCVAHNDGRVDARLYQKEGSLKIGTDIWFMRSQLRLWFSLIMRVIKLVR